MRRGDDVGFSISQFSEAWRLLCGASPGYAADGNGATEYIFSGLPIPFFNVALVTARDVAASVLQTEARQACEWAAPRSVPWMFIVTHDVLAPGVDATSALDSCGLTPMLPMTGMRAQHIELAALGRVNGLPVASAAVFMVDGHRYVALVATTPEQQRRGYAEAVMRHALDVAATAHGEKPTFLHATDAGRPVYARMGYQPVAAHTAFIEKRFLEGH